MRKLFILAALMLLITAQVFAQTVFESLQDDKLNGVFFYDGSKVEGHGGQEVWEFNGTNVAYYAFLSSTGAIISSYLTFIKIEGDQIYSNQHVYTPLSANVRAKLRQPTWTYEGRFTFDDEGNLVLQKEQYGYPSKRVVYKRI